MAERTQVQKPAPQEKATEETPAKIPSKNVDGEALKSEIDDLLDEIDAVLEENSEEFVSQYVQKGGE